MLNFLIGKTIKNGGTSKNRRYPEHLIKLAGVTKVFKTEAGDFTALKGIDLKIGEGEFVGIIGKSGSGKSTLINMITGIDRPTKGEIVIHDTPIHKFNEGQMAKWRGKNLGIVFQFFQLLPMLTVIENVMLPMDFCNFCSPRKRRERALELLEMVGVREQANKLPSQLSGGQQQRVAIARALANDPPIILADEPTGNLDSKTAEVVFNLFEALVRDGKTIVMVTHDHDLAEKVSRTIIIADGELIEEYVAKTFPNLTQEQLVRATASLQAETHEPGSEIIKQGEMSDKFYIITRGAAETVFTTAEGKEMVISRLEKGQHFGEVSIVRGGKSPVSFRAADNTGAEVAAMDKKSFNLILDESEPTRNDFTRSVEEYFRENIVLIREPCHA